MHPDHEQRLESMRAIARERGGRCLSQRYVDSKTKLRWRCAAGHEWSAIPLNVARGHWCPVCGNERQGRQKAHTIEMMREVAARKGGECLSESYRNNLTKLRWRCCRGHEWEATPTSIVGAAQRPGSWCPICAGKLPKDMAVAELRRLAEERGGELLSKKYKDAKTHLRWRCGKGHEWNAVPDSVRRGTWCPICGGSAPANLRQMQEAAKGYGGCCLSRRYADNKTKLLWQCAEGHEWQAKPGHVLSGHWCPVCAKGVSERICRRVMERITGERFPSSRPEWLVNDRGNRMELDGYSERLGVAFEYQGAQHYTEVGFFTRGKPGGLAQRRRDDAKKWELCARHGVALIEVPHDIPPEGFQAFLTIALDNIGDNLARHRKPIDIKRLDVWNRRRLEEMRKIAEERGGVCLSGFYIDNSTKLRWQCAEGHEWEAVPASIKAGTWCGKCGDKRSADKRLRYTIEDIHRYAESRGGECLSREYRTVDDRLRWRCAKGHVWEAKVGHVVLGNHWCPTCGHEKIGRQFALSIEDMREAARRRGGECLSEAYDNQRSRLRWRCSRGHEWEGVAMSVRRGTWCPVCAGKKPRG